MKPVNQSKALFRGAFILTIAALITKVLSAFYRIPYQNIVGDIGFYIYQQVYPFYAIAVVLASTGFPVVISKLYAEQKETGNIEKKQNLLLWSFLFLQAIGFICFIVLYAGSSQIAQWMHDPKLTILLKVVSIVFLLFPIVSIMRGYYQGMGNMIPTALSQVGEQSTRVLTIIIVAYLFTKKGYSLYLVGGGAMFGSITGSIISALILFTFLWVRKEWKRGSWSKFRYSEAKWILKELIFQGLTICISGMLLIFIQMADSLNLYSLLVAKGIDQDMAKSLKGVFDRGQPLIQLGTVAATSMSLSLVPLISSERLKGSTEFLREKIRVAMRISLVVGAGASVGLCAIIRPTNTMLFENDFGSSVLGVLSFVILFTSIISTIVAILQGLGILLFPALVIIAALPVKYSLNLLFVPLFGTMGAAIATIITLFLVSLMLIWKFKRVMIFPIFTQRFLMVMITATVTMAVVLAGYDHLADFIFHVIHPVRLRAALKALSAVLFGGVVFLLIVIRGKVFLTEELALFPFGSKLIRLLPQKDRGYKYD